MIHLFAFLLIFIILLIALFYWQHRYFHPDSLREIDKRERKLLKQAAREIKETRKTRC